MENLTVRNADKTWTAEGGQRFSAIRSGQRAGEERASPVCTQAQPLLKWLRSMRLLKCLLARLSMPERASYSALASRRSSALTASRGATPSNSTAQTASVIGMSIEWARAIASTACAQRTPSAT